jgi:hypothetical protein
MIDEKLSNEAPTPPLRKGVVMPSTSFSLSWKNADTNPPNDYGRFWCIVQEQNDLGVSHYQWNCFYHKKWNSWEDNGKECRVIWWTELAPMPF